jgi:putative DNA methylase
MTSADTRVKKLIEVSLPLPEINDASSYDKMPGIGPHPKGIHHWWARLPLPAARAVLFASVVDDPEAHPEKYPTEEAQNVERERLFGLLRQLMEKRLHEAPEVYTKAQAEMLKHCEGKLPAVFDPFAGGGSIPLEANRMGFETHAGDLNPVAVLLNKCNIELAPRWIDHAPINPEERRQIGGGGAWRGTDGLAADIRYFGCIVHERTFKTIGHLYPKARLPKQTKGTDATVIAWIWARTVASPNPATRGAHVPLMNTFWLSSKKGAEAWLEPIVDKATRTYRFEVKTGSPKDRAAVSSGTKAGRGGFKCLLSDDPIPFNYIRAQGQKDALGEILVAIIAEGGRGRIYLPASDEQLDAARSAKPAGYPETYLPEQALGFRIQNYGVHHHWQMFTPRQLTALVKLSESVRAVFSDIICEAMTAGMTQSDSEEYAKAIVTFLALALDRCASFNNRFCRWNGNQTVFIFTRQAIPMLWDFSEANIMGERAVCWHTAYNICADAVATIASNNKSPASASQIDAASGASGINNLLVSTDPPYYDNIGYAALSDFFYVWLRPMLGSLYGDLFSTVLVPKQPELTASPERFGGDKNKAKEHFESGFRLAFTALRQKMDPRFPLTVYYAFRQDDESGESAEEEDIDTIDSTTGWETLLEALISSGFQITATWPVRASFSWRMRALSSNALASYIVLACRPRPDDAPQISSVQFRQELKGKLPTALRHLQQGNIAPVDFAQAAIGPGMAIYSRYSGILESSGKNMPVRAALGIINQTLTEVLRELEDDFDADTRWAIAWFEEHGFSAGDYGSAEVLSKAKATSVSGLGQVGIVQSKGGKVRLLRPEELPTDWTPAAEHRLTVWGMTHHLLRVYHHEKAGDEATAALLRMLGSNGEVARELAYRLFKIAENKKFASEAQSYNSLVLGWPEIARIARATPATPEPLQQRLI